MQSFSFSSCESCAFLTFFTDEIWDLCVLVMLIENLSSLTAGYFSIFAVLLSHCIFVC